MKEHPLRKPLRLQGYSYAQNGSYFVTVCTKDKQCVLSHIHVGQGLAPAENHLTRYGRICEEELGNLAKRYSQLVIDRYVVMPNHVHLLLTLRNTAAGASPCPTISEMICTWKSRSTIRCKQAGLPQAVLFQTSFHDHIIRSQEDYSKIWNYIDNNPFRWAQDKYFEE